MTHTAINPDIEQDRARWERYARLIDAAGNLESLARSSRVTGADEVELRQEANELRAIARRVSA